MTSEQLPVFQSPSQIDPGTAADMEETALYVWRRRQDSVRVVTKDPDGKYWQVRCVGEYFDGVPPYGHGRFEWTELA